ncbi:hypothetical protein BHE74_00011879, partial [Ensete ventricosum]
VLALLHPHCVAATVAPAQATAALYGRQSPCQGAANPAGDRAVRRQQPLAGCSPCERLPPCMGPLAVADRPLQVARPWPTSPAGGLAVANHLCMQTACMWLPLPHRQCLLLLSIATTRAEIVYPCISDPDIEDKGGQASSSLAVSIRWISTAKLSQSDLATLAQREEGE